MHIMEPGVIRIQESELGVEILIPYSSAIGPVCQVQFMHRLAIALGEKSF